MKFNHNEKSIEQVGNIENNNVSIDTNNIDFIVTILSTNLYSNPIESFIRETVSNAWDSHTEAGKTDPVILELGVDTEGTNFCRIQDFGVGLSPERFDKVYKNIGSSTKRGSNEQIGGFGIGRFSALAYSDMVYITSNFDGIQYKYLMYKDGNSISIDKLHEKPTTEGNGLEVMVNLGEDDIYEFSKAITKQLVYFENLYVIDSTGETTIEHDYNNFSIKKYKNFYVNTLDPSYKELNLVLGKVRYPLRVSSLSKDYPNYISKYPISVNFEIGDLEVTPNREEILYSTKNVAKIEERLDAALEEVQELINDYCTKDFTSLTEYRNAISENYGVTLLEKDHNLVSIKIPKEKTNFTLLGNKYEPKQFLKHYEVIMGHNGIVADYVSDNGAIRYLRKEFNLKVFKENSFKIYNSDISQVKSITKKYIREELLDCSYFVKPLPLAYYIKKYARSMKMLAENSQKSYYNDRSWKFDIAIFKVLAKFMISNVKGIKTFSDSSVPQSWIDEEKIAQKEKRKTTKNNGIDWKQNVNIHEVRKSDRGYRKTSTDSLALPLKDASKKYKRLTVYGEKGDSRLGPIYFTVGNHMKVVEVAPTKMKLLKEVENFVTIEEFMDVKYKIIRNIGTLEYIRRNFDKIESISDIDNLSTVSTKLDSVVKDVMQFKQKNASTYSYEKASKEEQEFINEVYDLCEEKDYFNEEIRGLLESNKELLKKAEVLLCFSEKPHRYSSQRVIPEAKMNICIDYILARKLFRPNIPAVFKLKTETIFNIKPEIEENEDN